MTNLLLDRRRSLFGDASRQFFYLTDKRDSKAHARTAQTEFNARILAWANDVEFASQARKPEQRELLLSTRLNVRLRELGTTRVLERPAHPGRACRSCHATPSSLAWRFRGTIRSHHSNVPRARDALLAPAGTSTHSAR